MSIRTKEDKMNNNIPSWCYDEKQNIFCHGQICSDCPRREINKEVKKI